jgi:hypothetical protein
MFASHHVLHLIKPFQLFRSDGDAKIGLVAPIFPSPAVTSGLIRPKACVIKDAKFGPNSR